MVPRLRSEGSAPAEEGEGERPSSNHFRPLNLCSGSSYRLARGIPIKLPPEPGSGCGRRAQAPKKADPKKEKPAKQVRAKPSKLGRMVNKKTCAACMGSHRAHTCGKAAPVY